MISDNSLGAFGGLFDFIEGHGNPQPDSMKSTDIGPEKG